MQYIIRSYQIQNNQCSTELKHGNQGTPSLTTNGTLTGRKKLQIFCCLFDVEFFNNHLTQMP